MSAVGRQQLPHAVTLGQYVKSQRILCKVSFVVYLDVMKATRSIVRPGPAALKALAHPDRIRILGLLRTEGSQTSTTLAKRLGLNTGATSYHLRQLAKHGFITDADEIGNRRERWWRASHRTTSSQDDHPAGSEEAETTGAYIAAVVHAQVDLILRANAGYSRLPTEWRAASTASDATIWMTPEEARMLSDRLAAMITETAHASEPLEGPAPEGASRFTVQIHAFPHPGYDEEE